ncbi:MULTISPECIES: diaminopimelate epimerase [Paenibacillus]|uniref:diaminopimelate epimerase n=1 Tax=Paenibacillus TaxID=44249 RepID=UPI00037AFA12|nr:diaminopimelate epimerase [Paenibacillus massiliensis]
MNFTKMHGLGNDFIVIYGEQELPKHAAELAQRLCHRHFGIGADGIVYILPSEQADFRMRIINSDGSEAEQCGNAIRCVAKYVYDQGHTEKQELTVETRGAGVQHVKLTVVDGQVDQVRVDMGAPVFHGLSIPMTLDMEQIKNVPVEVEGHTFHITGVSMGNPHAVIFVEDAPDFDLHRWGPLLESHELFPNRTNVEFVTVRDRSRLDMRVWERGAGPTLACGTGACATLVAAVMNGYADREALVSLAGGDLHIEWSTDNDRVYMTGPATIVYHGNI